MNKLYNEVIVIDNKEFNNFDLRKYREQNILFKQKHYEAVPYIFDEVLEIFFNNEDPNRNLDIENMPIEEVANEIVDLVQISSVINSLDFLIPCPISSYSANIFFKYGLFLNNIYYTENDKDRLQNYTPLSKVLNSINNFDNKKFILKL